MKTGIYEHYKGKKYLVIGTAQHSETQERLVVYVPLYDHTGEPMSVRPYEMFNEEVLIEDQMVPRFKFIGEKIEQ